MNKKQLFLTILSLFLIGYFIFSITTSSFAEAPKKHIWEIGTDVSYISNKMPYLKAHGVLYGLDLSHTYRGKLPLLFTEINHFMLKIEGKGSFGKVDNNGSLDNTGEHILEFRGLVGYDFSILKKNIITPYSGIGYRYLKTNKTGVWNEDEIIYLYSPIGVETNTELGKRWSIGTKLEYDYFLWGEVHTSSNFVSGDKFDQERGYGLRGSMKFQKKANKVDLLIEPFLNYWHIKESKASSIVPLNPNRTLGNGTTINLGITYPKNHSTEIGVRFAVRF